MKRSALALVLVCGLLALGCPGQKPAAAPALKGNEAAPEGPLVWHLSKSGLGFRLSNADEDADKESKRGIAPSSPLGRGDAEKIVARLPALQAEPDDAKDFAMRDKSIPAPRPGKTVTEAFPPPGGPPPASIVVSGPLTVERHAPEGPVDVAPHLTMTFSQPMVPITSMDDLAKERLPVTLIPQPPGKWRWLGTKTLMFQPEKRFPMATEYAVEIPANTKAMNGQTLAKAVQWTFTTPPLTLKNSFPRSSQEPLEPLLFAEVDQQIDPKELLASIELSSGNGPVAIRPAEPDEIEANDAVRRLSQQAEKGRWIAFRPAGKLPTATAFTARIKAGAPSAEGPRRTVKDQAFSFSTYGPLRVDRSYCAYGSKCVPLSPFTVIFSNSIDLKTFDKKLVSVVPELPGMKVDVNGQSLTISGRSKGRTKYAVTIAGAIGDIHHQTLGADAKLNFEVGSAEPQTFGPEGDMVVLDPSSPKAYTVYSINEPGFHARVFSVGPEDWEKYVAYMREWERPRKLKPPGRLVSDKVITTKKALDELVATPIDLAARPVFLLHFTPPQGPAETFGIDDKSFLPACYLRIESYEEGPTQIRADYADYRRVHGLMLPFTINESRPDNSLKIRITKYELNPRFDPDTFSNPERIKYGEPIGITLATLPEHIYKEEDGHYTIGPQRYWGMYFYPTESWTLDVLLKEAHGRYLEPETARAEFYAGGELVSSEEWGRTALRALRRYPVTRFTPQGEIYGFRHNFSLAATQHIDRMVYSFKGRAADGQLYAQSLIIPVTTYEPKTKLIFPMKGKFMVTSGHEYYEKEHKYERSQQFAVDIVALGNDFEFARNEGATVDDYVGYARREIIAPADGRVVFARNDIPDGTVKSEFLKMDHAITAPAGNVVIIDHGQGEFSVFCHMHFGSVRVKSGEVVRQGQVIGLLGAAGSPGLPHLHYQLQNGPNIFGNDGLPLVFTNIQRVGWLGRGASEDGSGVAPVSQPRAGIFMEAR